MLTSARDTTIAAIYLGQCRSLIARYPALAELGLTPSAENAQDVFKILCWHVRRIDPAAQAVDQTNYYEKLLAETRDPAIYEPVLMKLLAVQSGRGLAHKVQPFVQGSAAAQGIIDRLWAEHASQYGADLTAFPMAGRSRGACLVMYYAAHADALRGKRLLHFAPEAELRAWMTAEASRLGFTYATADGFMAGVDHYVDLAALPFAAGSFDLIINHRVLEHVLDDASALREMYRVLSPGGCLDISVPEIMYLATTADWRVPDAKVHGHFRNYGRDFPVLLAAAGFTPERCDWLFRQTPEKLQAAGAYPLLFYNARSA